MEVNGDASNPQGNVIHLNAGDGTFRTSNTLGNGMTSVALGDVDGEGDLDIVLGDTSRPVVYLNQDVRVALKAEAWRYLPLVVRNQ